jgi:hypothetical protein
VHLLTLKRRRLLQTLTPLEQRTARLLKKDPV